MDQNHIINPSIKIFSNKIYPNNMMNSSDKICSNNVNNSNDTINLSYKIH